MPHSLCFRREIVAVCFATTRDVREAFFNGNTIRAKTFHFERVVSHQTRDELKPNYLTVGPHREMILSLCMVMAEKLGPKVFADQSAAIQHRPDQCDTLSPLASLQCCCAARTTAFVQFRATS